MEPIGRILNQPTEKFVRLQEHRLEYAAMRYFESIYRAAEKSGTGAMVGAMPGKSPILDLDEVADYYATGEGPEWSMLTLPVVEPPSEYVNADYEVPAAVMDSVKETLESGAGFPMIEEWAGPVRVTEPAQNIGATIRRMDAGFDGVKPERRKTLEQWTKSSRRVRRAYGAVVIVGGGQCDWMYAVGEVGEPVGLAELNLPERDLRGSPDAERQMYEQFGMAALMPILLGFSLLACKNVSLEASPGFAVVRSGPRYARPVIEPLVGVKGDAERIYSELWVGDRTARPGKGDFVALGREDPLPEGFSPGLYWVEGP